MISQSVFEEIKNGALQIDPFREPIDQLLQNGQYDSAYRFLKILQALGENRPWIEERLGTLYRKWIPRWHFRMLNDTNRSQAFADALDAVELRGKTVLDVGTGSGLLAMLAVRCGARHVYACEAVEPLAETAEEIVRLNGMGNKITIIPKSSFEMEIGKDMPERADVMVSETMDSGFVGEGFLTHLHHAREHLLQPGALLVPCAAQLYGVLIESPEIYHLNHVHRSQGFDVSRMNRFSTCGYFSVRLKTRPHRVLSEVKTLIDLDLYAPVPECTTRVIEFRALQDGTVHGVAFWFKATLAAEIELSNDPSQMNSHWMQVFASAPEPIPVQKGEYCAMEFTFQEHAVSLVATSSKLLQHT